MMISALVRDCGCKALPVGSTTPATVADPRQVEDVADDDVCSLHRRACDLRDAPGSDCCPVRISETHRHR